MTVKKAAAIDVGTNSTKLAIGQVDENGVFQLVKDMSMNVRLGEGLDKTRRLDSEAQDRTARAVGKHLMIAWGLNVNEIKIVATSAVRTAENSSEFLNRIRDEFDLDVEVLSEDDEGKLAYQAVSLDPVLGNYEEDQVAVDVGGGSTEFTYGCKRNITHTHSLKLGAVRLTERRLQFETPNTRQIAEACAYVDGILSTSAEARDVGRIVGIGGSAVNLARIWKEVSIDKTDEAHASILTTDYLGQIVEGMCALSPEKRRTLIGLDPERADIILGGAIILERILADFGETEMIVSTMGLRHGLLYDMLGLSP